MDCAEPKKMLLTKFMLIFVNWHVSIEWLIGMALKSRFLFSLNHSRISFIGKQIIKKKNIRQNDENKEYERKRKTKR